MLNEIPAFLYLQAPDYSIKFANKVFKELFGDPGEERCFKDSHKKKYPFSEGKTFEVFETGEPVIWDWEGIEGKHFQIFDYPFTDIDNSPLVLELGIDITDRKDAEKSIQKLNIELEDRVLHRTRELEAANRELESFAYSVSHDLRAPLRVMDGFSKILEEDYNEILDEKGKDNLNRISKASQRMGNLIDDLLSLSRIARKEMMRTRVNLSGLVKEAVDQAHTLEPDRKVEVSITPEVLVYADLVLMRSVLQNLIENSWKFTSHHESAHICFGSEQENGETVFYVKDDGAGFDMKYVDKLFGAFQRLHRQDEFSGSGIGLTSVQRIIHRHGGRVWGEGEIEKGATIYFTLPVEG